MRSREAKAAVHTLPSKWIRGSSMRFLLGIGYKRYNKFRVDITRRQYDDMIELDKGGSTVYI